MRSDMMKVIQENGRTRGAHRKGKLPKGAKKLLRRELENNGELTHNFESMSPRRVFGWNSRESGHKFSALRKWLKSQVGRKWDAVYSDICFNLERRVFSMFIEWNVATNVEVVGNDVYDLGLSSRRKRDCKLYQDLYVDPDSYILKLSPYSRRRFIRRKLRPDPTCYIYKDETTCYCKNDNNIWYECFLKKIESVRMPSYVKDGVVLLWNYRLTPTYDCFLKTVFPTEGTLKRYYNVSNMICYKKRALNKREIRRIKELAQI